MVKSTIIGLKELRENTEHYIEAVGKGKSFTVVRRSKPVFCMTPVDEDNDLFWDTVIDFTDIDPHGVPAGKVAELLEGIVAERRTKTTKKARV